MPRIGNKPPSRTHKTEKPKVPAKKEKAPAKTPKKHDSSWTPGKPGKKPLE